MTLKELEVISKIDKRRIDFNLRCMASRKNSKGQVTHCKRPPGDHLVYEDNGLDDIQVAQPCKVHVMEYLMARGRNWKLLIDDTKRT